MSETQSSSFGSVQAVLLLGVTAAIAYVLYPFFGTNRDTSVGRWARCQTNEMQIGRALSLYAEDYDSFHPSGTKMSTAYGKPQFAGLGWAGQSYPYMKNTGLFRCPEDRSSATGSSCVPVSYAFNSNICRNKIRSA